VSAAAVIQTADPFSGHMEAVARKCLGDPNPRLSTKAELRFGTNGSVSIDLEKGVWSDHEAATGGGVMDFLAREKGLKGQEAIAWLRSEVGAHFEDRTERQEPAQQTRIVATYDYVDEHGELLFQVCRMAPKTFRQRRPDPTSRDGWSWSVKGARPLLYRLPEVLQNIRTSAITYVVEGEKDADNLAKEGICATCNPMGAGKWSEAHSELLAGADVVILPDNDDAGQNHAQTVAASLKGKAKRVRVLHLPDLPPKGDVSDWLAEGGDATELLLLTQREAKAWAAEAPKSQFGAIQWADVDFRRVAYQPLIKGLMFQGDKGMVFGESGSGKSFLCVDMGISIARGVPFLGMKTAQGSVLYQAGEGGRGLQKRIDAYKLHHQVTEDVPFVLLPEKVNLFASDGDAEAFINECVAWKSYLPDPLAMVVIDTFSTASPGANENDAADMGRMLDAGDRLNKATGAAVIWVHHKNASGLRERGHTSFRANIETAIEVTRDQETKERTLHLVKLKDGEDGFKAGFELQSVKLGIDDDGDDITSCVVSPAQMGSGQTGKRTWLKRAQFDFLRTLETATHQYGGMVPGVDLPGVHWDEFKKLFVMVCGFGREPGAIKTALSRDGKELMLQGLIGRQDPWLWITPEGERCL
jgi:hypothetical protein